MELIEIRKRAIKYCESLSGLTDKEKEIAYKAYVSALSDAKNSKKSNVEKITTEISHESNMTSSCGICAGYGCMKRSYSPCNTPSSC